MKYETLRSLVGADAFDALVAARESSSRSKGGRPSVEDTATEPGNDGLTIEQGRNALKIASERKIDLPSPSVLFKR